MKYYILALFACTTMFGCKDNPVSKKINETREGISNSQKAVKEVNKMQGDIEELQATTPLTNDELKAFLPDQIMGMKRISYNVGEAAMLEVASVRATYVNEDRSKKFSINVIDGAGQMGAAMTAGMRMMLSQDFEEEDEYSSRRTVTKKGKKAVEEYESDGNNSSIKLMEGNRFYLEADGENMSLDETWEAIDKLNLKKLG